MSELVGWRIAAPEFAASPEEMLSGEGAYRFGGRWNSKGTRVVYLGTSVAQASMELLVHIGRSEVLKRFNILPVYFSAKYVQHIAVSDLPEDWHSPSMASSVQAVGDAWAREKGSLILQVPSAAVMGEYNFLLNPAHPDYKKIKVGSITPFNFDKRLL